MSVKRGLGKGLDALFDIKDAGGAEKEELHEIRISLVEPNRDQPRKVFDEEQLKALSDSISKHGVIQPIIVVKEGNGFYKIIAGERRWRAAKMCGLSTIPAIVRNYENQTAAEVALIENLQREDLNPYEEALGYSTLIERFSLTQEDAAERVGKSRAAVANALRLLKLPEKMLNALREGKISAGHARALLAAEGEKQEEMFRLALAGASVRSLEAMTKKKEKKEKKEAKVSNFHREVALSLKEVLHRPVTVKSGKGGKGTLTIEFYSDKELGEFAKRLADKEN